MRRYRHNIQQAIMHMAAELRRGPLALALASEWNALSGVVGAMVSEALIIHMLSTWSVYGVFGPSLLLLQKVVGAMVSMVSDGLDLGGRGYGVSGV